MPTEIDKDGFQVVINTGDEEHPPPHVHVYKGEAHCRITIGEPGVTPPEVYAYGKKRAKTNSMRVKDVARAIELVAEEQGRLLARWRTIHG